MRHALKSFILAGLAFLVAVLLITSCSSFQRKYNLSPEHEDFISKVRYIITKQERRIFLNLPSSERKAFIEEFWKNRDPDPSTEDNEFKERYFKRIEEANYLFKEGGTPGWLQDRGRIYILLGPPENRQKYPTGYTFYGRPMEIWFYGTAPVIFIDSFSTGDYELYPLSAQYIANLLNAQMGLKPQILKEQVVLDFNLKLEKIPPDKVNIFILVPYKNIWFSEEENTLKTTLRVHLEIFSEKRKKIWDYEKEYTISFASQEIKKTVGKDYLIPIETTLSRGKYTMTIHLENETDGQKIQKSIKFKWD